MSEKMLGTNTRRARSGPKKKSMLNMKKKGKGHDLLEDSDVAVTTVNTTSISEASLPVNPGQKLFPGMKEKTFIDEVPYLSKHEENMAQKEVSLDIDSIVTKPSQDYLDLYKKGEELEALVLGAEDDVLERLAGGGSKDDEDSDDDISTQPKRARRPVWQDDDDVGGDDKRVNVAKDSRYRKLAKIGEVTIKQQEYQDRLKKRFEAVVGSTPAWADLDLKDSKKVGSEDEDEEERELAHRTGDYTTKSTVNLPPTFLEYKPVSHANKALLHKTTVSTVRFHPTSQVVMTAGKDNTLSFFQVDGVKNAKIQSMFIENFPIYCARFDSSASNVILGSRHKSFYDYDMLSGKLINVQPIKGLDNAPMSYFEMSSCGRYIVFRGDYGYVHIISTKSKELVGQMKMNGSVNCMTFSSNGNYLYTFGDDAEVYVWDMNSRQCIHRFRDEGCLNGTSITLDSSNKYIVCGSEVGVVNIYNVDDCMKSRDPKPIKVVNNLLTKCTTAKFNSTSQILALSSSSTEKSVKMVSMNALSVYQNFPSLVDKMSCPTDLDFSPNSGYLAAATNKGIVNMYRLQHFKSY